jgi:S1-C subfamily serine protease
MRLFKLAALAALAFFVSAHAFADPSPALLKLHEQALVPSVMLEMGDGSSCSGTVIYSEPNPEAPKEITTYILTALHCVKDEPTEPLRVEVPTYDKMLVQTGSVTYRADVYARSWKSDSALLVLKDQTTHFEHVAKIAPPDEALYEGEDTWAVGYPLGTSRTITRGVYAPTYAIKLDAGKLADYDRATNDIAPGSSGGGLFHLNTAGDYELIGTTTAGYRGAPFMGLYTGVASIQDFLKSQAKGIYEQQFGVKVDPPSYQYR